MSTLNLNKVVLAGRLTADPELKASPNGVSVLNATLAVNRRFQSKSADGTSQQQTDFISLVAWRQVAEIIAKYFKKGSSICVTGSIQTRSWTDNNGTKRYATEVLVDEAMFVDSKSDAGNANGAPAGNENAGESNPPVQEPNVKLEGVPTVSSDDELPF